MITIGSSITTYSCKHPRRVTAVMVILTLVLAALAGLPTLWPGAFSFLHPMDVDTDPENMLPADEPVRVFHDEMKKELAIHDMVVVGIVNEKDPDGVFNPQSLRNIYELTEFAKTLRWNDPDHPGQRIGVIEVDMIAPSVVDNVEQGSPGSVTFEWLMRSPPQTREEALAIRAKAMRLPFLMDTLVSGDGKAICLYLPITSKDLSHRVYSALRDKIAEFGGDDSFYITGLPVAEDTFGVEMFWQMAISAPMAMVIIFLLMWFFFRKPVLIVSPMIVAVVSVVCTMALLIITGKTVHIMSSMIPIFIMPIAVVDSIHILSEFFDRYQQTRDRRKTIAHVMDTLFTPMLYTSLTTAVGFASLALTPIPPVQVFGLFVAFGVLAAWVWTVTFIPAFVMFIPERWLTRFGTVARTEHDIAPSTALARFLSWSGGATYRQAKPILLVVGVMIVVAGYGIGQIRINDNPIKWFSRSHPIRVSDTVLNDHFGGTYMAYLLLEPTGDEKPLDVFAGDLAKRVAERGRQLIAELPAAPTVFALVAEQALTLAKIAGDKAQLLEQLATFCNEKSLSADADQTDAWTEAILFVDQQRQRDQVFKRPDVLTYMSDLQSHLKQTQLVGKSNSLADLVKTIYRELNSGETKDYRVPDTARGIAECLITFQNSNRPQDLWHFVTPDYRKANLWIQLRSGDNKDMSKVARVVDEYVAAHPPPIPLKHRWFGLTYINVIWQDKMVSGMIQAFLGSFLCVFLMMTLLYRSALWGVLCMIPLTVTIALIYGVIGLVGKDYDMPVAVLSSLSLGLAVDYAIHFLSRTKQIHAERGSWVEAAPRVFGEPARAITRNAFVVGLGFLPLLATPLIPYRTVGMLIAAILFVAGIATLLILPALMTVLERFAFPQTRMCCLTCNCVTCLTTAMAGVALVAVNAHQFLEVSWTTLTWFGIIAIVVLALMCYVTSRRERCRIEQSIIREGEGHGKQE